jgi:hypothetical protein
MLPLVRAPSVSCRRNVSFAPQVHNIRLEHARIQPFSKPALSSSRTSTASTFIWKPQQLLRRYTTEDTTQPRSEENSKQQTGTPRSQFRVAEEQPEEEMKSRRMQSRLSGGTSIKKKMCLLNPFAFT